MIEELLIALSGYPGDLFYPPSVEEMEENGQNHRWETAPELGDFLHPGERELLSKLLILASYVADFDQFIKKYDSVAFSRQISLSTTTNNRMPQNSSGSSLFGIYAASLAKGIATILENYRRQLIELENDLCSSPDNLRRPSNALARIYSELQSYYRIFPVLDKIRIELSSESELRSGGEILSILDRLYDSQRADPVVLKELEFLLRQCVPPFRYHLISWLAKGRLDKDRFGEFFVQVNATGDDFAIRKSHLPKFINEAVAEKILFIGKGIKRLLETSLSVRIGMEEWQDRLTPLSTFLDSFSSGDVPGRPRVNYDDLAAGLEREMENLRCFVSEKLFSYCFEGTKANRVLESWVKNAFFLGKGELFLGFIDVANSFLSGPVTRDRLEEQSNALMHYWTNAIEKIYWLNDEEFEYFDKIKPCLLFDDAKHGTDDKIGWNALRLSVKMPQQLTEIFTSKFMNELNTIFRFLLRWRRTQSLIEACWLHLKKSPSTFTKSLPCLEKIHRLTSLALFVVKNLQYYIQADVLETVYAQTVKKLETCRDFERVLKILHVEMLDDIFTHCFMNRDHPDGDGWQTKIGKILKAFGDECDSFSALILGRMAESIETDDDDGDKTMSPVSVRSVASTSSASGDRRFAAKVHESYVTFQRTTALLFKVLTTSKGFDDNASLNSLLLRLDYNDYFSSTNVFAN